MASGGNPGWRCIHCGFEIPSAVPLKIDRCPIPTCSKLQILEQVPTIEEEQSLYDFNLVSKSHMLDSYNVAMPTIVQV